MHHSADRDRFAPDELADVLRHYDVGRIRSAKEYPRGSRRAPKLLIDAGNARYLLKRRGPGRDDPNRVTFTHALLVHLAQKQYPVPGLVRTKAHARTLVHRGNRIYEMFEFMTGERYNSSLAQTRLAGKALAHFHQAVEDFRSDFTPPPGSYHSASGVRAGLNAIPTVVASHDSVFGHESELLPLTQQLHERYDEAAAQVDAQGFASWPAGVIHGDWHPGNMLFDDHGVCAVLDLEAARPHPAVVDIAYGMLQFSMLRSGMPPEGWPSFFDETRMRRFLRGYIEDRPLPPEQRPALLPLMIEALIAEVSLPIAVTGSFGRAPGYGVLLMAGRKIGWIQNNADRIREWILAE